jgi:hypothetical protein
MFHCFANRAVSAESFAKQKNNVCLRNSKKKNHIKRGSGEGKGELGDQGKTKQGNRKTGNQGSEETRKLVKKMGIW